VFTNSSEELRASARRDFPHYYAMADAVDAAMLDGLVMARAAIVAGVNTRREGVAPAIREQLEKVADVAEQVFSQLREAVRRTPAFEAIDPAERQAIERTLFDAESLYSTLE